MCGDRQGCHPMASGALSGSRVGLSCASGRRHCTRAVATADQYWRVDGQQSRILPVVLEVVFSGGDNAGLVAGLDIALHTIRSTGARSIPD